MKRSMIMPVIGLVASAWLGVALLSGQAAAADAKEANQSAEKGKEGSAASVALMAQAGQLVRYARDNESPLAMLTAVQMMRRVHLQEASDRLEKKEPVPMKEGEKVPEDKKAETAKPALDTQQLLAEAKGWAAGDEHVLALLEAESQKPETQAGGTLGSATGAIKHIDRVSGRRYQDWVVTFRGGDLAQVLVFGDGDTDLDLYIYDEYGHEIVKDVSRSDRCLVQWTPKWTGKFRVRIANLGYVHNNYLLVTN